MFYKHLEYVKEYFRIHGDVPPNPMMAFRSKLQHTLRVLRWAKRLVKERIDVDRDVLYTAILFHDTGCMLGKENHAERGAEIFSEYADNMKLDVKFKNKVEKLIALHSSKELLKKEDTSMELIILMEADILDEEGALRMVWYAMDKAISGAESYESVYDHIVMGNKKRLVNPMVTDMGKRLWEEKKKVADEFTQNLYDDVMVEEFEEVQIDEDINVRELRSEDSIEEITILLNRSYRKLSDMGFNYVAATQDCETTLKRIRKASCLIVLKGEKIIGTISVKGPEITSKNQWYNRKGVSTIGQFGVDPDFQGKGIGTKLMTLAEEYAKDMGSNEIALDTAEGAEHLVSMYKKRGYRFIEFVTWKSANYRSVILSKSLMDDPII